jgi:hypothetical protein
VRAAKQAAGEVSEGKAMMHDHEDIREVRDRMRRVETRVTKIGRFLGVDVGGGRPIWRDGTVVVPTPNCAIGEMLKVIPDGAKGGDVDVYVNDDYLFTLFIDP